MLTPDLDNLLNVSQLQGKNVNLVTLNLDLHLEALWEAQTAFKSNAATANDQVFAFMLNGPFATIQDYKEFLLRLTSHEDLYAFVLEYKENENEKSAVVGFVTYCEVRPIHRTCEIGHLWLDPRYRRRGIMDEAIYLMLKQAFEVAKYRRVQWTCNTLNDSSKKLALRCQFKYEGVLRNIFVVKGVNRDDTYLSIIDSEWPAVKAYFENKFN